MSYRTQSHRASVYSPITPSYGLGTMPGSSAGGGSYMGPSTYSASYTRRTPSSTRKEYRATAYDSPPVRQTSSSRPLPIGPGPLDSAGRRLTNYSASDIVKKTSTSSLRSGPLKADHNYINHLTSAKDNYTPSVGTLPRKYSSSTVGSSTRNNSSSLTRGRRAVSLANFDRVTDKINSDISNIKLNGSESVKASPRVVDSDDSIYNTRTSRKERYNFEQNANEDAWRTGSRGSRISSISDTKAIKHDDLFSPRSESVGTDTIGRGSSVSRESVNKRRDSINEAQSKSLSRQNSNSSLSTVSKYSSCGKLGLRNIGNTCFMNSVLQCLSNTRPLLDYCLKEDYVLDKNKTTSNLNGALIIAYANIIVSIWKDKRESMAYVTPNNFKSQIQKFAPRFCGYQQQDAQEFLRYLLEGLHEDVNRVTTKPKPVLIEDGNFSSDADKAAEYWKNYLRFDHSRIVEIFVGQLKSELKFDECGHRSVTFDPFWDLSLPIPKTRSEVDLGDCLSHFMKEENLDGDESPMCAKCKKKRSCRKRFYIQRFPQVLVFHLKRFSQERYSRKIAAMVNFPVTSLDLSEFAAEKGQRLKYDLYAVSEHSGTTYGGHYTAKCKHAFTGEWNYFNDTRVSPCGANQAVSSEAYVLFYEIAQGNQSRL